MQNSYATCFDWSDHHSEWQKQWQMSSRSLLRSALSKQVTTTIVLRPLYRSACISWHLQLRTGRFRWCKVLLPHALVDGNQHKQESNKINIMPIIQSKTAIWGAAHLWLAMSWQKRWVWGYFLKVGKVSRFMISFGRLPDLRYDMIWYEVVF